MVIGIVEGTSGDDTIFHVENYSDADGDVLTSGNDTVEAGAGNDRVIDRSGDDVIYGGVGDDRLTGAAGDDTIYGDSGDDVLLGQNDVDVLYGGAGNDDVRPGTGNDTAYGDSGDDWIRTGTGDDTAYGGIGDDTLDGRQDNDILYGGSGADSLDGSTGDDTLFGGIGADTIFGSSGADLLYGGSGADSLDGGIGDDTLRATGGGNDTLDGGENSGDNDILDLSGTGAHTITYAGGDNEDGTVTYGDGRTIVFTNIENVAVCFTRGTLIETDRGQIAIEDLSEGDKVRTIDNGFQPIRWIGSTKVEATGNVAPILIKAGALGNERDMRVSPQHRMLLSGWQAEMLFGRREVLATAKSLVNDGSILVDEGGEVEYFHMLFDQHEIVFAEGVPSESFHPGEVGMDALEDNLREEIFTLFPELRVSLHAYGESARPTLKQYEADLLANEMRIKA